MGSTALASLVSGVDEVRTLRSHYPVPRGRILSGVEADAARAHGRACVVLLSSHWERYMYALNEESVGWLNSNAVALSRLSEDFLLHHSRFAVDALAETAWNRRADALRRFASSEAQLWNAAGQAGALEHDRMLSWMKAPHVKDVVRFFRLFGVPDVMKSITRVNAVRAGLWLTLQDMVDKRNAIAHGDASAEALPSDITRYINAVLKFSESSDKVMARRLAAIVANGSRPW
jgi:hypothetical protein